MTAQTLFFTDRPIGGLATYIGGSEDNGSIDYRYKEMMFSCPCIIPSDIIPGLVQYGIWPGFSLWIFDLAKEYLMKVGNVFILI
ncbi:MAG: hypothetical protein LBG63_06075 [Candidatus Methanoplasma sp.]|jgi:hypothetical protein|nr:hypothetical protein [Candidatus Methanoplasma sp.]